MKTNVKILHEDVTRGRQSLIYRAVIELTAGRAVHKIRVRRKRDAYDFQSCAVVERWDGNEWREVDRLPYLEMATCPSDTYVVRHRVSPNLAECKDRDELISRAVAVLS